jgi:uncharacterized protein (TIGR02453 family)
MTPAPEPFTGFTPGLVRFFTELAENNERDWFLANKTRYEDDVRAPMAALISALSFAFQTHDIPLMGDPKTSMFRINRDVRFSHDKRPYKTNASAVLSRDGAKQAHGLMYLQFGADEAFAAMGFYAIEPDPLAAFRHRIVHHRTAWADIVEGLSAHGLALSTDDALTRLPRGFDADEVGDLADVLKLKVFTVRHPITLAQMQTPALVDDLVAFARAGLPLLKFGWGTDLSY